MVQSRRYLLALIAVAGLLLVACSDDTDDSGRVVSTLHGSASPEQAELLADGVLTSAEYEQALLALVACLEDRGIDVVDTEFVDGRASYSTRNPVTSDGQAAFDVAHGACRAQHFNDIERAWAYANADPEDDAAFYEAVAVCVRGEGVEVDGTRPHELSAALRKAPAIYHQCFDAVVTATLP